MAGSRLGRYHLLRELGSGAMATVYLAEAGAGTEGVAEGERVAVKVVHSHLHSKRGSIERFTREAEIGAGIRHPNVVRTIEAGTSEADGATTYFLVMEYVEGQTLRDLVRDLGSVPENLCRHIGREVARALIAIHAAGIVHRDLKPENILITKDEIVKVMDLGVARVMDEAIRLSLTGQFLGSILYAAPEQYHGSGSVDGRSDLYSLGLVLFELATGRHPFFVDDAMEVIHRQMKEPPPRPSRRNPQISPFFEEVVLELLAKDREDRFASAEELLDVLERGEDSGWWIDLSAEIRGDPRRKLRRMRIPRETSLFGRDGDVDRLTRLWARVKEGAGHAVLLEGEAGIGKSRLVDEFAAKLEQEGEDLNFIFGAYPPGAAGIAARAFSTAYLEHLGESNVEARLRGLLHEAPALVRGFSAFLTGELMPVGSGGLSQEAIVTAFVHVNRALADERPTLVLIDDLHFASEEGRALFAAIAHALSESRLLLVGTTRPGLPDSYVADLSRLPHVSHLVLERLSKEHVHRILVEALGSRSSAADLATVIAEKSDGNPYFVFEILAGLKEEKRLTLAGDGGWTMASDVRSLVIPRTVKDLVQSRISLLDEEERELLEVAACCGFMFDPVLVAETLGIGLVPALKLLSHLERNHRIVRTLGRRFEFDHHQVQEALYSGMSLLLREEYHAALGDALVRLECPVGRDPADLPGETACAITTQLLRGGRGERSLPFLEPALRFLESSYRHQHAADLATLALQAPGLLRGGARARTLFRHARVRKMLGQTEGVEEDLSEAIRLFDEGEEHGPALEARRMLGKHYWETGSPDRALALFEETGELASRKGDAGTRARLWGDRGNVYAQTGRFREAEECFLRYREVAEAAGDREAQAQAVGSLALTSFETGDLERARERFEECLPMFRELGILRGEATAIGILGLVHQELGRFDDARSCHERNLRICRRIGYRRGEANALGNLGLVHQAKGMYEKALLQFERDLRVRRETSDRWNEAQAHQLLGVLYTRLGALEPARENLERSSALYAKLGFASGQVAVTNRLAELLVEEGALERALERFRDAERIAREIGKQGSLTDSLLGTGRTSLELGLREEARAALREALELARARRVPNQSVRAAACLAVLGEDPEGGRAHCEEFATRIQIAFSMEAHFTLWRAGAMPEGLERARGMLRHVHEHAPPKYRESLLERVGLHRSIRRAPPQSGSRDSLSS